MNVSTGNFTSQSSLQVYSFSRNTTHGFTALDGVRIGVLCFNLFCGVPTYSCVLFLIITGRNGVIAEFFNFSLNVCEILFSLTSLAFLLSTWFPSFVILQRLSLGLAITTRPLFQCLMCVERYLAVVHPVTFLKYKSFRCKIVSSLLVWLIGLGSCLFCMCSFALNNIYAFTWCVLLQFLVFLSIQLLCCLAVLRALKQSGPGERGRERERGEENHTKRRAFHLILITTVSMIIIYAPFIITSFLSILTRYDLTKMLPVSFSCFILGGFVLPILYLQRARKRFCLDA